MLASQVRYELDGSDLVQCAMCATDAVFRRGYLQSSSCILVSVMVNTVFYHVHDTASLSSLD